MARTWARDIALGVLVTSFLVFASAHLEAGGDDRALDALGYGLIVVAGASLTFVRRWPWAVVGVVTVALTAYLGRHYVGGPIFTTGWIALFALGWRARRRDAFIAAGVLCAALIVASLIGGRPAPLIHLVFVGWSAAAVFLGDVVRSRRAQVTALEERARHLERTREEEARRRVAEERLHIARDLHDSVAHSMATINVQAGVAAHVIDRRPEAAREALVAIQRASGEVLDELAALLGLFRDENDAADRAPTPGLEQVAGLVASTEQANVPVTLTVAGSLDAVPKPVSTAAYRIVQESLTNVLRHTGDAHAAVTVAVCDDGALTVEIVDDGDGAPGAVVSSGTGMGIRGMKERAAATGGAIDAGPAAGGGFAVRAAWPGRQ